MRRYLSLTGFCLLVILIGLGALPSLPAPFRHLEIAPLALMLWTARDLGNATFVAAVGMGLVWDAFSLFPFGMYLILFPLLALAARFLFLRWFTSRSPISLLAFIAMGLLGYGVTLAAARLVTGLITRDPFFEISFGEAAGALMQSTAVTIGCVLGGLVIHRIIRRSVDRPRRRPL